MIIGGFEPLTLSDYPGEIAAVVFTQGCNFRCPFCHNGSLLPASPKGGPSWDEQEVLEMLARRRGKLGGVVISGGEPTIQGDLSSFIRRVRGLGLKVKLDTNGSRPEVLRPLFQDGLLDYVAMDVKAPWTRYDRLAGTSVDVGAVVESICLIACSGVRHEFRTTVVEELLTPTDVAAVVAMIPAGSPHTLQEFRPELALDPALRARKEVVA
jgi:pyruvate formate lyase activating enzyme